MEVGIPKCYTVVKVDGATPKRWISFRGHYKPIHRSCAIYFPGGIDENISEGSMIWELWNIKMQNSAPVESRGEDLSWEGKSSQTFF